MLLSLSSLLLIIYVYSEPLASFTGPSYISFNLPNQTQNNKFDLSFKTHLSYGLILTAFDSSLNTPFRVYLNGGALTLGYNSNTEENTVILYASHRPNTWNNITLCRQSTLVTIFVNTNLTQISLSEYSNVILKTILIGGLPDSVFPFHQFNGFMKTIILDEHVPLLLGSENQRTEDVIFNNILIFDDTSSEPPIDLSNQTVTIDNSEITFPIAQTSFSNFSLSFEFKSPDNTILFLTFQMRQYFFSLRKDYNQLILELNLHGQVEHLVVELTSVTDWISVTVRVTHELTLLSAGDRNVEVKSHTPIANRPFDRRPVSFGWSDTARIGFRGCLRKVVVEEDVVELYDIVIPNTGTLVGCWYPTPDCHTLACPYSCTQTWEETKCVSVAAMPEVAEFTGFGIIQIAVPSLLSEPEQSVSIKLQFVSTSSNDDHDVLLNLQHTEGDMRSFVTLQMLEGFIMLSFSLSDDIILNTDLPLNDGQLHSISVRVTPSEIAFQVDTRIKRQAYNVNMSVFAGPTSIKIGGSSLKINSYGFSGCLSDIMINDLDLLLMTTTTTNDVVMQDVLLGQCSLIVPNNATTPSSHPGTYRHKGDVMFTTPLITQHPKSEAGTQVTQTSVLPTVYNNSSTRQINRPRGGMTHDEQLMIGLMLGVITVVAVFVFLAYLLWQKRQMQRAAKERLRKTSEELDEEFLNKTYNPRKQDKYTLFTPHALDAIAEESEGDERVSLVNLPV